MNNRLDNARAREICDEIACKGFLDEEELETMIVDTASVLTSGRYKMEDYLRAVEFCSYRLQEDTQVLAYKKTFPSRCVGKTDGAISGKASIYGNGKLVVELLGMSYVPIHLLYGRDRHKSLRKLSWLVDNGDTDRIQMESADKLLAHLKPPEEVKIELEIGLGASQVIEELSESLDKIALMAQAKIESKTIDAKTFIQRD